MLKIKNLHVSAGEKKILKGLSLEVQKGVIHAIMGPNGSGKSTLASVLMGHPAYAVVSGEIRYLGEDLLKMSVDERAHKGIFLSFQYPAEIAGVAVSQFLRVAQREVARGNNERPLSLMSFKKIIKDEAVALGMNEGMLERSLNEGFSGGEKKRNEILQMAVLKPKLVILDEVDSGLDVDALRTVAMRVKRYKEENPESSVMIITHYMRILKYLEPDVVSVIMDGQVVKSGDRMLSEKIEHGGYETLEREGRSV
jgi:Fe-S cluster assembly ATP-binding protein